MECRATEQLHKVEDGIHKGYVCTPCAITTGYVHFLPSLAEEIQHEQTERRTDAV